MNIFANFYNNITDGETVVYAISILGVVIVSAILAYNSAMGDIRKEYFRRNKK